MKPKNRKKLLMSETLEEDGRQEELSKAFDTNSLNSKLVNLREEQAKAFVDLVQQQSTVLSQVRVEKMSGPNKTIATIDAWGRFLKPGTSWVKLSESDYQKFTTGLVELNSKLVRGAFLLTDEEIQDNIEQGNINSTMMKMVAKKVANEMEEACLYGRKRTTPRYLNAMFDGWLWKMIQSGNVVDGTNTSLFADAYVARDKFVKLKKSIPNKWRSPSQKILTPNDVVIDYNELYTSNPNRSDLLDKILNTSIIEAPLMQNTRPIVVSGGASTTCNAVTYDGTTAAITVASATGLSAGKSVVIGDGTVDQETYTILSVSGTTVTFTEPIRQDIPNSATVKECTLDGAEALLTDPLNLILGIQTGGNPGDGISFETERVASIGWIFHFKMRSDTQVAIPQASWLLRRVRVK